MKTKRLPLTGRSAPVHLNLARAGMPSADSIHDARKTVKARGRQFRILRTTEVDEYESTPPAVSLRKALARKGAPPPTALAAAMKKKPMGDNDRNEQLRQTTAQEKEGAIGCHDPSLLGDLRGRVRS
jgi:hypothetical protein